MFNVTFEIVTEESAEHGEAAEQGFIDQGLSLRDAIDQVFKTRTNEVGGFIEVSASDSRTEQARWIGVYNGMEYRTGAYENRALHFPESLTPSTRRRIARLCGVKR